MKVPCRLPVDTAVWKAVQPDGVRNSMSALAAIMARMTRWDWQLLSFPCAMMLTAFQFPGEDAGSVRTLSSCGAEDQACGRDVKLCMWHGH